MSVVIEAIDLRKHFRVSKHRPGLWGAVGNLFVRRHDLVRAVDGVNFKIQAGELVGYIGPNGAGKSTTIKMLSGLLVPSDGTLRVNGFTPSKQRKQLVAQLGTVFGQRTTLWWDLPVIESLELLQHIYRIPSDKFNHNLDDFRQLLDLDAFLQMPVRSLSLGQRMRADLCAALLHDPPLLFLDEPTIGLDVVAKERIRQFIHHINAQRGTTIILTTHDLSDVERLCERVMIIDHGRLLYDGRLEQLRDRFGGSRELEVDFAEEYDDVDVQGARVVSREDQRVVYQFERSSLAASELIGLLSSRFRIRDLKVREPDIENTVRRIYEERLLDT
jgi:ABC-2 type transport system ATP-binding protein